MDAVGTVIIGAGVVGLAIARALARAGQAPVVLEHEAHFGEHLSSRNSEVIHGGLYYPPDSSRPAPACAATPSSMNTARHAASATGAAAS